MSIKTHHLLIRTHPGLCREVLSSKLQGGYFLFHKWKVKRASCSFQPGIWLTLPFYPTGESRFLLLPLTRLAGIQLSTR